jgi:hypothetical protein
MMRPAPFDCPGTWLKANLHTHTDRSDGALTPAAALAWYGDHGYDVVALTDHDHRTAVAPPAGLTMLPGAEITIGRSAADAPLHLVALGLPEGPIPPPGLGPATVAAVHALGGLCFLAHPYWSGLTHAEVLGLRGALGLEVLNHGCEYENRKGLAVQQWDEALAAGWSAIPLATDDSHFKLPDHGGAWVMLRAASRSPADVLAALAAGRLYASTGPIIEDVVLDGSRLRVRCSPAAAVYWMGQAQLGWSVHAPAGARLTEAELAIDPRARYVRVEVHDHAGGRAFTPAILPR